MDTLTAQQTARKLMNQYGLQNWSFGFDHSKRRFGVCRSRMQRIQLSKPLTALNSEEQVLDTILHEIAHALVGAGHGHDWVWKQKARAIGAKPTRCYSSTDVVLPKMAWTAVCPKCNAESYKMKMKPRSACAYCCKRYSRRRWDAQFILLWHRTGEKPRLIAQVQQAASTDCHRVYWAARKEKKQRENNNPFGFATS